MEKGFSLEQSEAFERLKNRDWSGRERLPTPLQFGGAGRKRRKCRGKAIYLLVDRPTSCVILLISVRMRAPFAPHMSSGSRATRRILKRRHPIPSDEISRYVCFAGDPKCVHPRDVLR